MKFLRFIFLPYYVVWLKKEDMEEDLALFPLCSQNHWDGAGSTMPGSFRAGRRISGRSAVGEPRRKMRGGCPRKAKKKKWGKGWKTGDKNFFFLIKCFFSPKQIDKVSKKKPQASCRNQRARTFAGGSEARIRSGAARRR